MGVLRGTAQLLVEAEKFVLPINGEIYRDNGSEAKLPTEDELQSTMVMPAPVCAFEYAWTKDTISADEKTRWVSVPTKRITLVIGFGEMMKRVEEIPNLSEENYSDIANRVAIFGLYYSDQAQGWTLPDVYLTCKTPFSIVAPPGMTDGFVMEVVPVHILGDKITEREKQIACTDHFADITAVIQACHSMRAGATPRKHTEQSSNRRQYFKAKGAGGFEYHTLVLPGQTGKAAGVPSVSAQHASGWSPRHHFRRAHIRKLSSGALTFVRHTFVGKKEDGEVMKRYAVGEVE
jgi:hypothetical protein